MNPCSIPDCFKFISFLNPIGLSHVSATAHFDRIENFASIRSKCSARMRTRRRGRWLLKQPRLGARMCQGTSFFILRCLLQPLLLSLRFLFPVRLMEPAHILQTHIRIRRVRRSWNGDLCSSHTDWRSEHPLQ